MAHLFLFTLIHQIRHSSLDSERMEVVLHNIHHP